MLNRQKASSAEDAKAHSARLQRALLQRMKVGRKQCDANASAHEGQR